ncbi:hypothetical protein SLEP1_g23208 [Rubroshorea leprosula]|uniref:Reverse transcriptase Ty1/copia-type domain-containing protein n=1 Tax=Rubroshorea leprosula TaxID=152421 RepID=A0AAV5JKF2_9ROSI|nr:hypothetical protein SLEP1_g23208 [Rubroshorea leprosula]
MKFKNWYKIQYPQLLLLLFLLLVYLDRRIGIVKGKGRRIGRLFALEFDKGHSDAGLFVSSNKDVSSSHNIWHLWHRRLGHLNVEGIQSQRSCPTTPQQNAIAERKNRHILEGFLCYDPKIGRIRISRHVVFLENLFYFDAIAKPNNSSPSVLHDFSLDHNAPAEQVSIDQFHVADEQPQTCSFHQPEDGTPVDAQSEAVSIPCWKEAMDFELSALLENDTWDMVPCPSNVSIIGSRWVFSVKLKADDSIEWYKARLVAQGYKQEYGIDYIETFAPMAKMTIVRLLIALSAMHQWPISQMDVKNAFLHGNLKETVYIKPPPGYSHSKSMVCKLKRSLYGLKQAPRAWFERFRQVIVDAGCVQSSHDYSLFMHNSTQVVTLLLIYVDDMLITGSNKEGIAKLKELLCRSFQMKDLGPLTYFLGLEVHSSSRGYAMNQRKYVLDLIQFANLSDDKCVDTPMEVNFKLRKEDGEKLSNPSFYHQLVGHLLYLTMTRPDIAYAVQVVSQFVADPRWLHLTAVLRII